MLRTRTAIASALATASLCGTAVAEIITVCKKGCDYTSINAAIAAASDGDTIQLANEIYLEGEQVDTLGKSVTLRGALNAEGQPVSVLSGQGLHRVITCQSGETDGTVLENLVVADGRAQGLRQPENWGGGLAVLDGNPVIRNCRFRANLAGAGGGAFIYDDSSPEFIGCAFESNIADTQYAGVGGGVAILQNFNFSTATFEGCRFDQNSAASRGGGMAVFRATADGPGLRLTGCEFSENTELSKDLEGGGGAVFATAGRIDFIGCTFEQNYSKSHGGVLGTRVNCVGEITFANTLFSENTAESGGGVLGTRSSLIQVSFTGCGFAGNNAAQGGDIQVDNAAVPVLANCILLECCSIFPPRAFVDDGGNTFAGNAYWTCDPCLANVDCSGNLIVDSSDLGTILANWATTDLQCDLNKDGFVDAADIGLLIASWGPCN